MAEYKIVRGGFHEKFHDCRSKIQIVGGGFANGKTSAVCVKAIHLARDYPGSNGLIGRATYPKLNDTIRREFFKWLPKNWIKRWSEKDNTLTLINGSVINFRYVQQQKREKSPSSTSNLLSATYDWIMIDQMDDPEFDYKDFTDLIGRLRGTTAYKGTDPSMPTSGPRWFCITLNPTRNWIYRKIIQHVLTYQETGKIAPDLQAMLTGYQTTNVAELITVHTASTYENALNLTSDYIHSMEAVYVGAMKDRFLLGGWEAFQGLIYPMFDQYTHMIDEALIVDWLERTKPDRIIEMYDHGLTATSCYMLAFGDIAGNYVVVDGFHNKNQSIEVSINKIKSIRAEWRIPPDLPNPIYADPAVFRKTSGEFKTVGKSIVDIFRANGKGINMTRGNNDISGGIAKISSYLTSYKDHENPFHQFKPAPFLYFNEDRLQFVVDEISDYFYQDSDDPDAEVDKPMGGKDHAMDALKYGVTSTPSVIELLPTKKFDFSKYKTWQGAPDGWDTTGHSTANSSRYSSSSYR